MMPAEMKRFLQIAPIQNGKVLRVLAELTDRTGFDSALIPLTRHFMAHPMRIVLRISTDAFTLVPNCPYAAWFGNTECRPDDNQSHLYDVFLKKGDVLNAGK